MNSSYANINVIEYITIASTGNATDFGDFTATSAQKGGTANLTRAVFGGGQVGGPTSNVIEFVTIASTGNGTDFGDLTVARKFVGACSDGHGGLQ